MNTTTIVDQHGERIAEQPTRMASPLAIRDDNNRLTTENKSAVFMRTIVEAVGKGMSLDMLRELRLIQREYEQEEQRKAYISAMAKAKANFPQILKNKQVKFESKDRDKKGTNYWHEGLAQILNAVNPHLSAFGLVASFEVTNGIDQPVVVKCLVEHEEGHCRTNRLVGGADTSGNKNSIQAMQSTITYLARATLKATVGVAAEDDDDDGRASQQQAETLTPEQVKDITKQLSDAGGNLAKFLQGQGGFTSLEEVPAGRYEFLKQEIARGVKVRADKAAAEAKAREDAMRGQEEISNTRANVEKAKPGTMI